jgi:Crinkler effector protein N-terminal domain
MDVQMQSSSNSLPSLSYHKKNIASDKLSDCLSAKIDVTENESSQGVKSSSDSLRARNKVWISKRTDNIDDDGNTIASASWPLTLLCLAIDNDKNFLGTVFPLDVRSNTLVGQAKKAVKAEKAHDTEHVDADRLILWKLSTPLPAGRTRAEKTEWDRKIKEIDFPDLESDDALEGDGLVQLLDPFEELSECWPDSAPRPEKKHLHLIVQVPASKNERRDILTSLQNLSLSSPSRQIGYTAFHLRSLQNDHTKTINSMHGPSSAAKPKAFRQHNGDPDPLILNLRPSRARGPPITLFHEVFNKFLQD